MDRDAGAVVRLQAAICERDRVMALEWALRQAQRERAA